MSGSCFEILEHSTDYTMHDTVTDYSLVSTNVNSESLLITESAASQFVKKGGRW
jgi:hypothetical protein